MSIQAMALVMSHSRSQGNARLVLLSIANHDGENGSYPSKETIGREANIAPRTVQRMIPGLVELGEVEVIEQGGKLVDWTTGKLRERKYQPNLYRILLCCPSDCDGSTNHRIVAGGSEETTVSPQDDQREHPESGETESGETESTTDQVPGETERPDQGRQNRESGETLLSPKPSLQPPSTNQTPSHAAHAPWGEAEEIIDAEIVEDELPLNVPQPPADAAAPAQIMVGAYADAVRASGGVMTKQQAGIVGKAAKRLLTVDQLEPGLVLRAVQLAGSKRSKDIDRFLGEATTAYQRPGTRDALRSTWAERYGAPTHEGL
jgi:Helix-turn-helix domain